MGKIQLQNFFNILNNDHPAVKLKFESSADSVDFLDVTVFKGKHVETKGHLSTKLYRKPTDTMELLHTQSYHPAHTFDGIVKSQILRFQRLCTEEEDFNKSCDQLFQALIPRNYTNTKLRKIKKDTIQNIGKPKSQYKKHHQALLQQPLQEYTISKCHSRGCKTCPLIKEGPTFRSSVTKQEYKVHGNMNCKSSNIVYLITCDRCALQYVGETSLPLHERMYKYRNKIDSDQVDPNLTAVEEHFRTFNNHDGTADFTIQPISFTYNLREFPEDNKCRLLDLEDFWIKILKTKEPQGLNQTTLSTDRVIPLILPYTKTIHEWGKAQIQHWLNSVGRYTRPPSQTGFYVLSQNQITYVTYYAVLHLGTHINWVKKR